MVEAGGRICALHSLHPRRPLKRYPSSGICAKNDTQSFSLRAYPLRLRLPLSSQAKEEHRHKWAVLLLFGGGGGSRTPVRKRIHISFSGRSLMFKFPQTDANRRASEFGSFILHAALKALRGHVHHCVTPYSQAVVLSGKMAAII